MADENPPPPPPEGGDETPAPQNNEAPPPPPPPPPEQPPVEQPQAVEQPQITTPDVEPPSPPPPPARAPVQEVVEATTAKEQPPPPANEREERKARFSKAQQQGAESGTPGEEPIERRASRGKKQRKRRGSEGAESETDDNSEEEPEEVQEKQAEGIEAQNQPKEKRRKHSLSAHLQAEIAKQKLAQAKQAREDRRADLEVQHHFLIQQVANHIDLKPKEVEEFVIDSPLFFELMDKFLDKDGIKSIIFSYQMADPPGPESGRPLLARRKEKIMRVLVSNGTDIAMNGICMYFIRLNPDNKVSMKTIADEIFFGVLDIRDFNEPGSVLETVYNALQTIYLKNLKINNTWVTIPDPENAANTKTRFITSINHYTEFLSDCKNDITSRLDLSKISDMEEVYEKYLKPAEAVIESGKDPETIAKIEHTVITWCKNIEKVLALSKQTRKETDVMGPLAELAYWRNLMAKMCYIIQQVRLEKYASFIQCLLQSKSRVLRRWKDVDSRVTDEFHEAQDNVRHMYALEKFCEPLYQNDPPSMVPHINSMMYTIRTIHTTSRYYNSCEKVTALMVKISNQMVAACRNYLTKAGTETVWSQEKRVMVQKLNKCLELNATYRGSYESTRTELENNIEGRRFNFSVNHIFGRFDKFCERLKKIIQIVEIFDMFKFVHLSHIDGLEEISTRLTDLSRDIQNKAYDPLEIRNDEFDNDFLSIRSSVDEIQKSLELFMDKAIEACPTAMHGLELLERFKNLRNRCLNIEEKEWYLFQFYSNEITLLRNVYEAEKNDTPIPRGFPPFCGKIAWSRHLYRRLERPMQYFQKNTKVLKKDEARPIIQQYNELAKKLIFYEILFHEAFCKQCPSIYDSLEAPILTVRGTIRQEMVLNFDPFIRQIIEETEVLRKLELEVPEIAQVVYCKQEKLFQTYEQIKSLLDRFAAVKSRVPNDAAMRSLFKKVEKSFMRGTTSINWTSFKCEEYFQFIKTHLEELEEVTLKASENVAVNLPQVPSLSEMNVT